MKKVICGIVLLVLTAAGVVFLVPKGETVKSEYLRIHIRANSNSEQDQGVKIAVKDSVVEFLIPLLSGAATKEQAVKILAQNAEGIMETADFALKRAGFTYSSKAEVRAEEFPARQYRDETFPSGIYDALIIELGSGEGDNWWCVAFPPLCFTPDANSKNIIYKSKIMEIIEKWKEQHG